MNAKIDIISESRRFAEMQGNSGRKVSRWIDQMFPNGEFRRSIPEIFHDLMSAILGASYWSVVCSDRHRPVLILSIKSYIETHVEICGYSSMFSVEVENQENTHDIYLVVKLVNSSEGVKGRQSTLQAFADILSTAEDVVKFSNLRYLDHVIAMHADESMTVATFRNANYRIQEEERNKKIDKYLKDNF
jgi:hypothetical protein